MPSRPQLQSPFVPLGRDHLRYNGGQPPHKSDWEFVQRVMARDPAALDSFVQRMRCVGHFVMLANLRHNRPLDQEALRDVVQDVLALVWRKLSEYHGDAALETWVYRFCDLQVRNAIRRAAPRRTVPLVNDVVDPRDREPTATDDMQSVDAALQSLVPLDASILRLKLFEAMTFEAMARRLARSPNTIKTRYYRALQKLRRTVPKLSGRDPARGDGHTCNCA